MANKLQGFSPTPGSQVSAATPSFSLNMGSRDQTQVLLLIEYLIPEKIITSFSFDVNYRQKLSVLADNNRDKEIKVCLQKYTLLALAFACE